jgi:cell division protein FtsB
MIRSFAAKVSQFVSELLQQPLKVLVVCLGLVFAGLFLDGSLLRLWVLHRDSAELADRMVVIDAKSKEMSAKIKQAKDPQFIEIQARDRFELAGEGDLIFVFSESTELPE